MIQKPDELWGKIPRKKLDKIFECPYCEFDYTFLGFTKQYKEVLDYTRESMVIIDLGCSAAIQSYYFKRYRQYIGVDVVPTKPNEDFPNDIWQTRLSYPNALHYACTIQHFIKHIFPNLHFSKEECFAVMSYVPDGDASKMAIDFFPNIKVYYPGGKEGGIDFLRYNNTVYKDDYYYN